MADLKSASPYLIGAAGALSSYFLLRSLFQLTHAHDEPIFESPLKSLISKLSEEEIEKLPYPPNVLPGARDVQTPYGSIEMCMNGDQKKEGRCSSCMESARHV